MVKATSVNSRKDRDYLRNFVYPHAGILICRIKLIIRLRSGFEMDGSLRGGVLNVPPHIKFLT